MDENQALIHVLGVIDLAAVTRLAAYPREAIYQVRLADGRDLSVGREEFARMVRVLAGDESRLMTQETAGQYDIIWRVEARQPQLI